MEKSADLFSLDGRGFGFSLNIGLWPALIILLAILIYIIWSRRSHWDIQEQEFNIFGQKLKIKPNHDVARIAHKAWTELSSRKAAILFDDEDDVISEVYDSWYALFGEIRSLVKDIPAEKIRTDPEVRKLVKLLMSTLNQGLRPHLTKYQANFRRWFEAEIQRKLDNDEYVSPQQIQRRFPKYKELTDDLKNINRQLVSYAKALEEIAHGSDDN